MRAPFLQLYVHLVWSTRDRTPLITPSIETSLYAAIAEKCLQLKCHLLAIGGMPDHIHLLIRFPPTLSLSTFVKEVKGSSSHLVTHVINPGYDFQWQGAYGAFTVGEKDVDRVIAYIKNQKQHHTLGLVHKNWEA